MHERFASRDDGLLFVSPSRTAIYDSGPFDLTKISSSGHTSFIVHAHLARFINNAACIARVKMLDKKKKKMKNSLHIEVKHNKFQNQI